MTYEVGVRNQPPFPVLSLHQPIMLQLPLSSLPAKFLHHLLGVSITFQPQTSGGHYLSFALECAFNRSKCVALMPLDTPISVLIVVSLLNLSSHVKDEAHKARSTILAHSSLRVVWVWSS